jgi:hypothetical protein
MSSFIGRGKTVRRETPEDNAQPSLSIARKKLRKLSGSRRRNPQQR